MAAGVILLQQILQLLWILCITIDTPDALLVQNPPTIPSLAVSGPTRHSRASTIVLRSIRTAGAALFCTCFKRFRQACGYTRQP